MTAIAIDTLLHIHTATHDVLKGYREMFARAQPDVESVIRRLTEMHERHAAEQHAELLRLREAHEDGASLQGTVNKVLLFSGIGFRTLISTYCQRYETARSHCAMNTIKRSVTKPLRMPQLSPHCCGSKEAKSAIRLLCCRKNEGSGTMLNSETATGQSAKHLPRRGTPCGARR